MLAFLPLANWIPGGEHDPAYARRFVEWGYGTLICAGVAVLAAVWARQRARMAHSNSPRPIVGSIGSLLRRPVAWLLPVGAFVLYALISRQVFAGRPLLIDEIVQLFQAEVFASGRLSLPVERHREFFSMLHVVDTGAKVYSQFPPGGPAMLALGVLVGAPWLVGPLCGAVSVALFALLVRYTETEASHVRRLGTVALFAIAPFGAFMFGSHMNHVPTLMWLLVATVGLARSANASSGATLRARCSGAALCGLGLGAAATIRPLDALAFGVPALVWQVNVVRREFSRWPELLASGAALAVPFAAMMYVNTATTGSPLLFGYEVLWGKAHGLGFHSAPWGMAHTPGRGIELLSLYATRLQTYFLETPFPALLLPIAALALSRSVGALDRYLLASCALLGALYFAYWHDGFFLGPRFVFPWLPVLVLWTARLPSLVREQWPGRHAAHAALTGFLSTGIVLSAVYSLPLRVAQYRGGLTSMRVDYAREATAAGVSGALVFVRESWGAQLVTRMWALGVSRSAAATLYHGVDACALDRALRALENTGIVGGRAERSLRPLLADSARVRPSPFSPDSTEKLLPGAPYDRSCLARITEDRAGYAHLAPLVLERASGNVYVRDLQARDSLVLQQYPARAVFLMRRRGTEPDAPREWLPLRRDSLFAAWRLETP